MTLLLIIIGCYIINIFLTRYINYLLCKYDDFVFGPAPLIWFIPIVGLLGLVISFIYVYLDNNENWFTGKNWRE